MNKNNPQADIQESSQTTIPQAEAGIEKKYRIYTKYSDILTSYHICPKIPIYLFHHLLIHLNKNCWEKGK